VTYFAYKYENKKSVLNKFTWILQAKTHIRNTNLLTAARNFVCFKMAGRQLSEQRHVGCLLSALLPLARDETVTG
jgi:hypothetical protein